MTGIDSVLLVAFGAPRSLDEVGPFLERLARHRSLPDRRVEEARRRYEALGGSPLYRSIDELARSLERELEPEKTPVFFGMTNWHPFLEETLGAMAQRGSKAALAIVLSVQQSPPGWDRYLEALARSRAAVPGAPEIFPARPLGLHPRFADLLSELLAATLDREKRSLRLPTHVVFTAHSIPEEDARRSPYVEQLENLAARVMQRFPDLAWSLAYQSRSGSPGDRWLEPDVGRRLAELAERGTRCVVVLPAGFVTEHMEVLYDLDIEARSVAESKNMRFVRVPTVASHPRFVGLLASLVRERDVWCA
ncbi:MAG: ferrochelatase [Candidatus Binatia bacterium]|nr:MAG: ferrochelatase [Candidatus Binatia bacterium]